MKQKKRNLCIFLLLIALNLSGINAQTILNVTENSGTHSLFNVNGLQKLIINSGNLSVVNKAGDRSDFGLISIRNLTFTNITSIPEINTCLHAGLRLYPNPVNDVLNISYESTNSQKFVITIIDAQSKVVYQTSQVNQTGTIHQNISVKSFQKGLYLCILLQGEKSEIIKFIKQ